MRISDLSSDVCSSDLYAQYLEAGGRRPSIRMNRLARHVGLDRTCNEAFVVRLFVHFIDLGLSRYFFARQNNFRTKRNAYHGTVAVPVFSNYAYGFVDITLDSKPLLGNRKPLGVGK